MKKRRIDKAMSSRTVTRQLVVVPASISTSTISSTINILLLTAALLLLPLVSCQTTYSCPGLSADPVVVPGKDRIWNVYTAHVDVNINVDINVNVGINFNSCSSINVDNMS
jgi:hypothetical protein